MNGSRQACEIPLSRRGGHVQLWVWVKISKVTRWGTPFREKVLGWAKRVHGLLVYYVPHAIDSYSNREYLVPLEKLQRCHVIDHVRHLEHVILSHCSYSLLAGHGSEIEYDFAAMERHVLDAFLQGKPYISPSKVSAIPYQNDAQKTNVFQVVRDQITQVEMFN